MAILYDITHEVIENISNFYPFRYNIGPMVRLEYKLLTEFLVTKRGYDPLIRERSFDDDREMVCKGLTLDCERGNLLR